MRRERNKRCSDLRVALQRGRCTNGNHTIVAGEGILQRAEWCQACPDSMRCFLVGNTVDVQEAVDKKYPCIQQQRYIFFKYHGACCLTFDQQTQRLNDWGYWGYSVTTSRSIRWYVEALVDSNLIPPDRAEPAIEFFKKRRHDVGCNSGDIPWFQC